VQRQASCHGHIKLTEAPERQAVVLLPGRPLGGMCFVVEVASPMQATMFSASPREASQLTMFVNRVADPVEPRVLQGYISALS
jgi:hypothetical protein